MKFFRKLGGGGLPSIKKHIKYKTFTLVGSNNRGKNKLALAKFHIELANQRKDCFFKLANDLAKKCDNVFIEDLNLKAMTKIGV